MHVLLTGASSFSGFWFARELAAAGHTVVATFRKAQEDYDGPRGARVAELADAVECVWNTDFGDDRFVGVVGSRDFDLLLHHGADVTNYKSWDFDPVAATANNTRNARAVFSAAAGRGCGRVVLTGSVFEPYEGVGDAGARALNPYGLSKHLSFEILRMEAERLHLALGKFVIPNPFGPREEMRFTSFLAKEWAAGRTPTVGTPDYVRDNIHVSLLAMDYVDFCETLPAGTGLSRRAPSGYIESQGAFARRVAREIGSRTPWACQVSEGTQTDFAEPMIRTNAALAARAHSQWAEPAAWDALAQFYTASFG
jgi:UDP-glucose 4-epimerase